MFPQSAMFPQSVCSPRVQCSPRVHCALRVRLIGFLSAQSRCSGAPSPTDGGLPTAQDLRQGFPIRQ